MQHIDMVQHHQQSPPSSGFEAMLMSLVRPPVFTGPLPSAGPRHSPAVAARRKANKAARRARRAVRVG